ncbi:MAG: 50S ribosomal protein L1 [Bacteroidales bacterium]|nr:50S ribosomal protein L1 [Bacteroidales bacterium]
MSRITKNQKAVAQKYDSSTLYTLAQACEMLKDITYTKFDSTVEITTNLGVDPRKANQMIRGVVTLPHGTGKVVRVLVLCTPDKENEAKEAGADYVGLDEYVEKIKAGWTDVDVIICTPSVMAKVGALGRILGPRGLMPNPKTGTVTMEVGNAVKEVKAGKIDFKVDKTGIIHAGIGKVSFSPKQICDNATAFLNEVLKLKPQTLKGTYLKGATICTTMSPALKIDVKAFVTGGAE